MMDYSDKDDYMIIRSLGKGSYAQTFLAENKKTSERVVIKRYKSGQKNSKKRVLKEIWIAQNLCGGTNIIKLYGAYLDQNTDLPALIFEYVHAPNATNVLMWSWSEAEIRYYARELLKGLAYAHSKNILHKDLKPENIAIDEKQTKLRIIDWGLSNYYYKNLEQTIAGTLHYKSPELLLGYSQSTDRSDMWSVGCILASWLFKRKVFFDGSRPMNQLYEIARVLGSEDLLSYTNKYKISFNNSIIRQPLPKLGLKDFVTNGNKYRMSINAISLVNSLLVYDHEKRLSAKEALLHPYFRD